MHPVETCHKLLSTKCGEVSLCFECFPSTYSISPVKYLNILLKVLLLFLTVCNGWVYFVM